MTDRRTTAPALDVPFEHDPLAHRLANSGGANAAQIASVYGCDLRVVVYWERKALASFARKWRRLYGTECPFVDTHREHRGGRNAEDA